MQQSGCYFTLRLPCGSLLKIARWPAKKTVATKSCDQVKDKTQLLRALQLLHEGLQAYFAQDKEGSKESQTPRSFRTFFNDRPSA